MLTEKDAQKYFLNTVDGEIYQAVAYCPYPTMCFQNVKTGEKECWATNCMVIEEFVELIPKKEG